MSSATQGCYVPGREAGFCTCPTAHRPPLRGSNWGKPLLILERSLVLATPLAQDVVITHMCFLSHLSQAAGICLHTTLAAASTAARWTGVRVVYVAADMASFLYTS
eukprot:206895-Chlamydomonas_euryale.AAC.2